ncbi:MAG: metallophosphoesterase [Pseudomonadota bacterium]|nr:metallophosphoesterase [Pseudomonadota bacterium]
MQGLRIAQISDTHLAPGQAEIDANFDALAAWIRAERPDLVVHSGDVTRDAPGAPEELDYARARLAELPVPVAVIPGNHDVGDNPGDGGYVPPSPVGPGPLAAWEAVFGVDRFTRDIGGWRVVGIDAQLFLSGLPDEAAQWDWLATQLATSAPVALFTHKPLFRETPDEPDDPTPFRYAPRAARERLVRMIRGSNVKLVGCGHVHQTRQVEALGVVHCWCPAAAFVIPDAHQPRIGRKLCGLLDWRLGADGSVDCRLVRPEGMGDHDITELPKMYG